LTNDRTKDEFMKLIAQEVRMYNKNGDDFQRVIVCFSCKSRK